MSGIVLIIIVLLVWYGFWRQERIVRLENSWSLLDATNLMVWRYKGLGLIPPKPVNNKGGEDE